MTLSDKIKSVVRDVPDFPKEGILFKDITTVLSKPELCSEIIDELSSYYKSKNIDAIAGIESRGFLFGMLLAERLGVPFIPIRKAGKLPYKTVSYKYELEYGSAVVEMHIDAVKKGWNVVIHDDLLATGGTAMAAAELIKGQGANIAGFSFLIELGFLNAGKVLSKYEADLLSLVNY